MGAFQNLQSFIKYTTQFPKPLYKFFVKAMEPTWLKPREVKIYNRPSKPYYRIM